MRILMLNNEFPPLGGGTATANLMLLREWAEVPDLDIDLVTATTGKAPCLESFAASIRIHKVPLGDVNPHHARNRDLIAYTVKALRVARRLAKEQPYDVVMTWHAVPAGAIALWLRLTRHMPYVIRIGGSDIPGHEARYRWISMALLPLLQCIWRLSSGIVVKCETEATKLRRFYRSASCTTIANGVDTQSFHPPTQASRAAELRLIIVARLIEHKGHRLLFAAMQTLVEEHAALTLAIVGTGDAEAAYREEVANRGLTPYVTFEGYRPREALPTLYRSADVFVLPSEGEGMSISTLEAMASGLALVITQTGGTRELLEEEINGLSFAAGDVEALTRHLRRLAADRDLVASMGKASREKSLPFSWTRACRGYTALLERVATTRVRD